MILTFVGAVMPPGVQETTAVAATIPDHDDWLTWVLSSKHGQWFKHGMAHGVQPSAVARSATAHGRLYSADGDTHIEGYSTLASCHARP